MVNKSITDIVAAIVGHLTPLESEDRRRVIHASLVLLGESPLSANVSGNSIPEEAKDESSVELSARGRAWIKQSGLSTDQVQQLIHSSPEGVEIIASEIPGKGNRDKVRNAYVLLGAAKLISTGEAKFDDQEARSLCERYGFFDGSNHTKYMKGGNEFTGSKDKGWTLTAPGLKHAATLILEMSK